eukprot:TRINITY_DN35579_c0_g1_i1.p1 TRINITY_DN35579_c0_g1~~TRINITY_DN35579_c0_g1_i1.p1  ORF type:complete len:361 (-),score=84.81 TRINITY_DN35579_c0_g1_i1:315-1397(-)
MTGTSVSLMSSRDLQSLPKAELHLHLEGAMRPETLTELCKKYDLERPADTGGQQFDDFGPFAACYMAVCECLREEADLFRLVREVAEDAAKSGAIWIEVGLSLVLYADRFGGLEQTMKILLKAAEAAEDSTGVGIGLIPAAERHLPPADAETLAHAVANLVKRGEAMVKDRLGIVGFGLHSAEPGNPPEPFAEAIRIACVGGVVPIPHAGELPPSPGAGPASVRFCVEGFGARRIAHGVLAVEDADLVADLAKLKVCLDICPTSNELLRAVPGPGLGKSSEHPLKKLLAAGVPCTINSDDPLLFGCQLLGEFQRCRKELELNDAELAACASNSFHHSRAPEAIRESGLSGVQKWVKAGGD